MQWWNKCSAMRAAIISMSLKLNYLRKRLHVEGFFSSASPVLSVTPKLASLQHTPVSANASQPNVLFPLYPIHLFTQAKSLVYHRRRCHHRLLRPIYLCHFVVTGYSALKLSTILDGWIVDVQAKTNVSLALSWRVKCSSLYFRMLYYCYNLFA